MKKTIYLTLDDGPSESTPKLLALLDRLQVRASFFVTNRYECPQLIREIHSRGHTLCLHSYSHDYSEVYASPEAYFNDLGKLETLLAELEVPYEKIVRFPGGTDNLAHRRTCPGIMPVLLKSLSEKGYSVLDWSAENLDGMNPGLDRAQYARNAIAALTEEACFTERGCAVFLSHHRPGDENSIESLEDIILFCKDRGYSFDTVEKLKFRPLYYAVSAEGRLFTAPSIERVLSRSGIRREFNEAVLPVYLQYGYAAGEETFYKGVYRCLPGLLGNGPVEKDAEGEELLAEKTDRAVERLMVDKTGAMLLSSGVDSSYMLAASGLEDAYGIGFENFRMDESAKAEETAAYLGRAFHKVDGSAAGYFAASRLLSEKMEQPMADASLPAFTMVCREAAEKHEKIYCAEGADELFGGYYSYQRFATEDFLRGVPYYGAGHFLMPEEAERILKVRAENPVLRFQRKIFDSETDNASRMMRFDTEFYLTGHTAVYADEISRILGTNIELPFLDTDFMRLAFSVPEEYRVNKYIFRKAAEKRLPAACAQREKAGFPVPVRSWMRQPDAVARIRETISGNTATRFFVPEELERIFRAFLSDGITGWKILYAVCTFVDWYEKHRTCGY